MKTKHKRTIILLLLLTGLLLVGGVLGYREYVSVRQAHLIKQTRLYLEKGNYRKAGLCLRRALHHNPKDLEACRLMAELMDSGHSPSALLWRQRILDLSPHSLADQLALVQTAVSMGKFGVATNALNKVDDAGRMTSEYHNAAGMVAVFLKQPGHAEAEFREAVRLNPHDLVLQLRLAAVRLQSTNVQAKAEARNFLLQLSSNATNSFLRCAALREVTMEAVRNRQTNEALAMSSRLLQETNAVFADRIMHLMVLQSAHSPDLAAALAAVQSEAVADKTSSAKIRELGIWEAETLGPAETLTWLQSLPRDQQAETPVGLLISDCLQAQRKWTPLQKFLESQNWGELDFLRHAYEAVALRGQNLDGAAKGDWELALKAADGQEVKLLMLLNVAEQWRWQAESENILWSIVNEFPTEKWAVQQLARNFYLRGRTESLMMLFKQEVQRYPGDLAAKNNLALTALLLDAQEYKPYELAREVYESSPTNASFASTFAFSLHLQKKDADALKIMQQLPPRDLDDPSVAGYYGVILRAVGDKEKAKTYLQCASKASTLPEERKLFDKATAGI